MNVEPKEQSSLLQLNVQTFEGCCPRRWARIGRTLADAQRTVNCNGKSCPAQMVRVGRLSLEGKIDSGFPFWGWGDSCRAQGSAYASNCLTPRREGRSICPVGKLNCLARFGCHRLRRLGTNTIPRSQCYGLT